MPSSRGWGTLALLALVIAWHTPTAIAQQPAASSANPAAGTPIVLPRPDFHFPGNVGRTYVDCDASQFPQPVQAPKGAPNIVLILIDDTGFGQYNTFGGIGNRRHLDATGCRAD